MNKKMLFYGMSWIYLQGVVCVAGSEPLTLSLENKALLKVFGEEPQDEKRCKLTNTPYLENLSLLERHLQEVTIDLLARFGQDWPAQRAKKVAFLKHAFDNRLSQQDIRKLVGEITLRAYLQKRDLCIRRKLREVHTLQCLRAVPTEPIDQVVETPTSRTLLESVFGKKGDEKRNKIRGTLFENRLGHLQTELQEVTVTPNASQALDWEREKRKKQKFLEDAFGEKLDSVDKHILLTISEESYKGACAFQAALSRVVQLPNTSC